MKVVSKKQNTIFVVTGSGDDKYKQELVERVKKNNLENNFFFLGQIPQAYRYLRGLNIFTLTSVKEGLPYCLLEAKMAGAPTLATSVGGIPEMSKNFPINLVESKNVEQIAGKILEILSNPEKFKVDDNLPKIYSLENMLDETEKTYKKIVL
jgi:glycosyltransferase involved in cell wall biosynthesis